MKIASGIKAGAGAWKGLNNINCLDYVTDWDDCRQCCNYVQKSVGKADVFTDEDCSRGCAAYFTRQGV